MVSNTYCVVFLFCFPSFSLHCPFLNASSVFSNVYLLSQTWFLFTFSVAANLQKIIDTGLKTITFGLVCYT